MRKYMVFYLNEFFIEVSVAVEAISGYAAKFMAIRNHQIDPIKITRVV